MALLALQQDFLPSVEEWGVMAHNKEEGEKGCHCHNGVRIRVQWGVGCWVTRRELLSSKGCKKQKGG